MDLFNIGKRRVMSKVGQSKENFKKHEFLDIYVENEIDNFIETLEKAFSITSNAKEFTTINWKITVTESSMQVFGLINSTVNFCGPNIDFCSKYHMEKLKYYWDAVALAEYLGSLILEGVKTVLEEKKIHNYKIESCSYDYGCGIKNDAFLGDDATHFTSYCTFINPNFIKPQKW